MKQITLKQFRHLHELNSDNVTLLLVSGSVNADVISINQDTFAGYKIDRKTIKELFRQYFNVDTTKWQYLTNSAGELFLSI